MDDKIEPSGMEHPEALLQRHRVITLYESLEEETGRRIVQQLYILHKMGQQIHLEPLEETAKETETLYRPTVESKPLKMVISTFGGSVYEMMSIYDMMKMCQDEGTQIQTLGIGKVCSAGVLLLAAGTSGRRKIAKHCRVMIHDIHAQHQGKMFELEAQYEDIKNLNEIYQELLVKNTKFTKKKLKSLLGKNIDVWISAKEALEYGIVDEIV